MIFSQRKFPVAWALVASCSLSPLLPAMAADDAAPAAAAQAEDPAMQEEYNYIKALVESGMPDLAVPVIAEAKKKWPTLGPKLRVLELQGELSQGNFAAVQKVADSIADKKSSEYWAIRLSMAEAYYARGMMKECREIYKAFFAAIPKPAADIRDFFVDASFKWAQMLVNEKLFDEAVKVYNNLLAQPLPEVRWCTVAMEAADLQLRLASEVTDPKQAKKREGYLKGAEKIVDQLLWKNELIIVFGRAVSMKAHISMLRDKNDEAQDLVNEYMPQLAEIHNSLVEQDPKNQFGYLRLSPMPACRYLLAKLLWETVEAEIKKPKPDEDKIKDALFGARKNGKRNNSGSFNHAINVFVKYPESTWASDAGDLTEKIAALVKSRYGKEIKTNISPEQKKRVRQLQFANAYDLYRDNNFQKAIPAYNDILRQFPETEESVGAIANVADSYIKLSQIAKTPAEKALARMDAEAVEGYLAERFSDKGSTITRIAGDELLRLASSERDAGALARSIQLYDMFFEYYPTHYNAAVQAFSLGARAVKQEDWELAARFYGHIANLYTNHTSYASALHSLSVCYDKMGNEAEYEKWLRLFADTTKKLPERTGSKLILAQRQQKDGFALFEKAAETNDVEAADLINKDAYRRVAGAIRDFRSVSSEIDKALKEGKIENKKEKDSLSLRCEQAMFLEADSWARMKWPADKVSSFRKAAVNAYEKYIAAFPKGQYAAPVMVKIGTIWTAEKDMEKSQDAFKRLQENYPDSDEAKNSVPRLAKTLIDMGLKAEGVAQYRQMLATPGGKYTAGQFLLAGDALLEAKSWDTAQEAYMKAADLVKGNTNMVVITMRAQMGKAKALFGAERYAESHEALDSFIEKYSKSKLVVDAYTMLVDVASHEGRREKDDTLRMKYFNQAVAAIKKLRNYKKTKAEQDVLDLESADILVRKMEAEESMNLQAQAKETCGKAVASFQVFLMANEPTEEYPFKDMTAAQRRNLERCYASVLPLMAKMGKDQAENTIKYANMYLELFPDGKNKTAVQNALNQAKAE